MSLFSVFAFAVFAAETVISPLSDAMPAAATVTQPTISFGSLLSHVPPLQSAVLGESTAEATPEATPTPVTYHAPKSHYTIALLGDSMIDTLGPDAPNIKNHLTSLFPGVTFTLLNYGVGGTNIDYGLERVTHDYTYLGKNIPSLVSQKPDIVIVESFGYNPYSYDTGAIDQHWLQLSHIVDTIKANLPGTKIVIAATIAPNSRVFGDGAPNLSFSIPEKLSRTNTIKDYLESTVKFAKSQHLPLIDAYHASLDVVGNGRLAYINGGDHIHYSPEGREFFAQKTVETIIDSHILE